MTTHHHTVVIVRGGTPGTDEYGDPNDEEPERIPLPDAEIAPRLAGSSTASVEIQDRGREGVIVGLSLFVRGKQVDVRHTDQVEVDGVLYDVEGDPGVWVSSHTKRVKGIQVALTRSEG